MKKITTYLNLKLSTLVVLGALFSISNASAQPTTLFTGPNDGNWSNPDNWDNGLPGISDYASINGNSGTPSIVDVDFSIGAVLFSGSIAKTISISEGKTLTLNGITWSSDLYLIRHLGNQTISISGAGQLNLAATGRIHSENNRSVSISSKITESGGSHGIIKTGIGTWQLINANVATSTFSGGVEIREGVVYTNVSSSGTANNPTSGPLGTGTLRFTGGRFEYTGSSNGNIHNRIEVEADVQIGGTGANRRALTFHGDVDLKGGDRVFDTNQFDSTANLERSTTFAGVISNGGFIKRGTSSVNFTAANTYTGKTVIEQGRLSLNSGGSIASSSIIEIHENGIFTTTNSYELAQGQVLTGNGLVDNRLRIGQGIINPGLNGVGVLNVDADVTFGSAGSVINFEADALGMDQLVFAGTETRTLSGNVVGAVEINIIDLGGFAGGEFVLISTAGLIDPVLQNWGLSTFRLGSVPEGWYGHLRMEGNDLVISFSNIPEAKAIWGALAVAGFVFLAHRRRKMQRRD